METVMEFLHTENFTIILSCVCIIIFIGFIILMVKVNSLNKKYKNFMQKLGNGKNIEEDLENYMYKTQRVENQNLEILNNLKNIENDVSKCIQKVGIVRYSAFKDTGSDLSFALALLDENNNGVVLNGIYSREMSNIYAKPVEKGASSYTLSEEETQAIKKAMDSENIYKMK